MEFIAGLALKTAIMLQTENCLCEIYAVHVYVLIHYLVPCRPPDSVTQRSFCSAESGRWRAAQLYKLRDHETSCSFFLLSIAASQRRDESTNWQIVHGPAHVGRGRLLWSRA